MKYCVVLCAVFLTGCSTNKEQLYYDAAKSMSRDVTVTQTACWAAVGEIGKSGDSSVKIAAIALAERCRVESIKIEPPRRNWLGL